MNKEISELFWVAVDIVGGIILLTFLFATQSQARKLFSTLETRNHAEEVLAENKSWRGYEGTLVTSADICNLVATHSGEDSCTIAISIGGAPDGADWRVEDLRDSGFSTTIPLTDTPLDWFTRNYAVTNTTAGTFPPKPQKSEYSQLWAPNDRKGLNTILDDSLNYTVKLYKDETGVVRWVSVQSWKDTAEISNVGAKVL